MIGIISGDGELPKILIKKLILRKIKFVVINLSKKKKIFFKKLKKKKK